MQRWQCGVLAIVVLAAASVAPAGTMSFQDYLNEMHKPGRTVKEFPNFTMIVTDDGLKYYYFTKPNHPAHPGVIIRTIDSQSLDTEGHSFAPDAAQPAFKAWMCQFSCPPESGDQRN
jgi:hypothetical protein